MKSIADARWRESHTDLAEATEKQDWEFKWRHFTLELILWCVRWYGSTAMSNAIARLKREGRLGQDIEHQQVKNLNNGIESDHALLKSLSKPPVASKCEGGLSQRFKVLKEYVC